MITEGMMADIATLTARLAEVEDELERCEGVLRSVRVKSSVEQVRFAADAYFAKREQEPR